ncbi:hypothetical protein H9P43_009709 [Blastocladiella emersonii ATCC 22665]|nr:hypothetical protein H9P43_009709 [Blastocladiella emersonii ATCC 22665]
MARPHTGGGPGGRKEIEVISKLHNDDELISFLNHGESVAVVDMYPHFCGPCEPMAGVFKRLKVDYSEHVIFAQAQTDTISYFEALRNKSCPLFSVWVCGVFVALVRGANSPMLERIVKEQIELNKTTHERKPAIPDVDIPQLIRAGVTFTPGANNLRLSTNLASEITDNQFTVSIIKPDAVVPHVIEEIMSAAKLNRFEVLKQRRLWLTEAVANTFYAEHAEKPFFPKLVEYMTSGPVIALLLSHENAVAAWRDVIGPASPKHAQEVAPRSLRAQFGKDGMHNAIHGSDSNESAQREMELLFSPTLPSIPNIPVHSDVTIAVTVLAPEVAADPAKVEAVVARALFSGFEIHKRGTLTLARESAIEWLGADAPEDTVAYWTAGPVVALVLKGEDVLNLWTELVGPSDPAAAREFHPRTLRGQLGTDAKHPGLWVSPTQDAAHREYGIFFPRPTSHMLGRRAPNLQRTLALIKPDAVAAKKAAEILEKIQERGFRIVEQKNFTMSMDQAQEFYKEHVGKPFYEELTTWMTSGPIYALVLEKELAITGWRETMGPTNALKAKEIAPDTLRAIYGTDGSKNALHGSDSPVSALREITLLFEEKLSMPSRVGSAISLPTRGSQIVADGESLGPAPATAAAAAPAPSEPAPAATEAPPADAAATTEPAAAPPSDTAAAADSAALASSTGSGSAKPSRPASGAPAKSRPTSGAPLSSSKGASRVGSASAAAAASGTRSPPPGSAGSKKPPRPASGSPVPPAADGADQPKPPSGSRPGSRASLRKSKAQLAPEAV